MLLIFLQKTRGLHTSPSLMDLRAKALQTCVEAGIVTGYGMLLRPDQ
jgi:hypothetical protein